MVSPWGNMAKPNTYHEIEVLSNNRAHIFHGTIMVQVTVIVMTTEPHSVNSENNKAVTVFFLWSARLFDGALATRRCGGSAVVSRCSRLFSVLAKKIIWQAIPKSSVDQVSRFLSIWVFLLYICSVRQQPPDSIHLGFPFTFWAILEGLPGIQITTKLKLVKKS